MKGPFKVFCFYFATVQSNFKSYPSLLHFDLQRGFDVFNALDLMDNREFLDKLKFGIGDGNLQYYLYNWKCPFMEPEKVSFSYCSLRKCKNNNEVRTTQ